MQGRGTAGGQGEPLTLVGGDIAQVFADQVSVVEVMMINEQLVA
jgi:hypothetical protein